MCGAKCAQNKKSSFEKQTEHTMPTVADYKKAIVKYKRTRLNQAKMKRAELAQTTAQFGIPVISTSKPRARGPKMRTVRVRQGGRTMGERRAAARRRAEMMRAI